MKKYMLSHKLVLVIVLLAILIGLFIWITVGIQGNKQDALRTADSIEDVVSTVVKDSQVTYERHWSINPSSVDVTESELSADAILALFSGSDITKITGHPVSGGIYRTKDGAIDTIKIHSNGVFLTICPDCDPPKPIEYGLIPKNAVATTVGNYEVYLIEHENNDIDLFMERGREVIWIWTQYNRDVINQLGDMILNSKINYSIY